MFEVIVCILLAIIAFYLYIAVNQIKIIIEFLQTIINTK